MMDSNLPLWIVEDCTWPVMWGLLTIALLGFIWFLSRQFVVLVSAIAVAGLVVAVVFLEMTVITDKEYVVDAVYRMAEAVRSNDAEGIVQFVAPENKVFEQRVRQEMDRYDFRGCQVNGFSLVELDGKEIENRIAKVAFSVWASGTYKRRMDTYQTAIVAVELEFAKQNGKWYVQAYGYKPANVPGQINLTRQ